MRKSTAPMQRRLLLLGLVATVRGLSPGLLPRPVVSCLRAPPAVAGVRRKVQRETTVESGKLEEGKTFGAEPEGPATVVGKVDGMAGPGQGNNGDPLPVDVFALPAPTSSLASLRVPASLKPANSYVDIFTDVANAASVAAEDDAVFTVFVSANRDLLDYRFQYKLTAQGLAAGNLGDAEGAAQRNKLRDAIVKGCLRFDAVLFAEIGLAEQRLGKLLGVMQSTGIYV